MTLKVTLVLLPYLSRDLISPFVGLDPLIQHHQTCPQFINILRISSHLGVKQFVVIIYMNLIGVTFLDEVVKRYKCKWNHGLNIYVIL